MDLQLLVWTMQYDDCVFFSPFPSLYHDRTMSAEGSVILHLLGISYTVFLKKALRKKQEQNLYLRAASMLPRRCIFQKCICIINANLSYDIHL